MSAGAGAIFQSKISKKKKSGGETKALPEPAFSLPWDQHPQKELDEQKAKQQDEVRNKSPKELPDMVVLGENPAIRTIPVSLWEAKYKTNAEFRNAKAKDHFMIPYFVNELQRMFVSSLYFCCMANPIAYGVQLNEHINSYDIHDNGGRPFRVTVDDARRRIMISVCSTKNQKLPMVGLLPDPQKQNHLSTFTIPTQPSLEITLWAPVASLFYERIWIADKTIYPREWNTGALKWAMGNSILLEPYISATTKSAKRAKATAAAAKEPKWLIAIYGSVVTTWQLLEKDEQVERFDATVQNSDVVYPAVVTNRYVYFLFDNVAIPRDEVLAKYRKQWSLYFSTKTLVYNSFFLGDLEDELAKPDPLRGGARYYLSPSLYSVFYEHYKTNNKTKKPFQQTTLMMGSRAGSFIAQWAEGVAATAAKTDAKQKKTK